MNRLHIKGDEKGNVYVLDKGAVGGRNTSSYILLNIGSDELK
jgi:hypothetical protein